MNLKRKYFGPNLDFGVRQMTILLLSFCSLICVDSPSNGNPAVFFLFLRKNQYQRYHTSESKICTILPLVAGHALK